MQRKHKQKQNSSTLKAIFGFIFILFFILISNKSHISFSTHTPNFRTDLPMQGTNWGGEGQGETKPLLREREAQLWGGEDTSMSTTR